MLMIGQSENSSYVLNCPEEFDLNKEILAAEAVYIATAFAHESGWRLIKKGLKNTQAKVKLIAGLNFCQSEPRVLEQWISPDFDHAEAYCYIGEETFHPKVMIVKGQEHSFAIVGSGNMSRGGYIDNVECNVYLSSDQDVERLIEWYQGIISGGSSALLNANLLADYKIKHAAAQSSIAKAKKKNRQAQNELAQLVQNRAKKEAGFENWDQAIKDAKAFYASDEFANGWYRNHKKAAKEIKEQLGYPNFNFGYEQWDEFYRIESFGNLNDIPKKRIFGEDKKLKDGLKQLLDESIPVAERVNYLVDNNRSTGISGMGINTVSKALLASAPKRWPVMNGPVENVLDYYGYAEPFRVSKGDKYAAYAELMQRFIKEAGIKNMMALDCFFYWKNEQIS